MTRKYYKNELSTTATKIVVDFICPNTNEHESIEIQDYQLAGINNEFGSVISARILCEKCKKIHFIHLKG